jgi:uncharacterized membrane protein
MTDHQDQINQLLERLEMLSKKQEGFSQEISRLRLEINALKAVEDQEKWGKEAANTPEEVSPSPVLEVPEEVEVTASDYQTVEARSPKAALEYMVPKEVAPPKMKRNLEKFIGENLINKIGIAITVIGVAIGAKYSIEHNLINPLTRIILGYLAGIGLLGFGIKLKKNYESYSAVLVSGAMAILYFITYLAYDLYGLIPQLMAFGLMVGFTAFTVVAALNYNKQVIAQIGLVGAYAVPFLLSEGSGQVAVLFSYVAIINLGILVIAFKKYWKPLYYSSFVLTWLLYTSWWLFDYQTSTHFGLALTFLGLFFAIFYLTFLAYKLLQREQFSVADILLLLANSFIFYGIGYALLSDHQTGEQLLGLFTLGNAAIHFVVSAVIYRRELADKNLFYLVAGLVLVFITIAIPVQLDGNWVTLLWAAEAALLFWIGRTKEVAVYEWLSYPLMFLAFFSLLQDWSMGYNNYYYYEYLENQETGLRPFFNVQFLSSILFLVAFGFINKVNQNQQYASVLASKKGVSKLLSLAIPGLLLLVLYYALRLEIENYWDQLYFGSTITSSANAEGYEESYMNDDLLKFKTIWVINYSLLFAAILSFVNISQIKNALLGFITLVLNVFAIAAFLVVGLYTLSELRESYLGQYLAEYYQAGIFHLGIRYVCYLFVALVLYACYAYRRQDFMKWKLSMAFDLVLHLVILWVASSELINWMDIANSAQSYKLGLSILWGVYALILIALGIWKSKQHLRIGAIVLFGITLVKLFFYDISHLDTLAKTIVFVSLGVLLLIISFLYNKYKLLITDETTD